MSKGAVLITGGGQRIGKALSVYLGHFPTMSHDAARQAVAEIIAADSRDRGRAFAKAAVATHLSG